MHAILSSVALLATSAMAAPTLSSILPRQDEPTCTDASMALTHWTVAGFDYHSSEIFTTPAHQNSWGYVNFTLSNGALDYSPICSAASNQLSNYFYGTMIYECELPEEAGGPATFTFNQPTGELRVNQTWTCPEEGARFMAEGGVVLDLSCHEQSWQNPNWTLGETYSTHFVTCDLVDAETPIEEISAVL
jgi:hypothetical protein